MKGLINFGRASEETRGTLFSTEQVDPVTEKIREVPPSGPLYRSQPTPFFPQIKTLDPL